MATDYTVVKAEIKCVSCNYKDILYLRLEKNQVSTTARWTCPDCRAERTITVQKAEPRETKEVNEEPAKNYIERDGRRIQVDENGEPIEKSEQFRITTPKKKSREHVDFKVGKIE